MPAVILDRDDTTSKTRVRFYDGQDFDQSGTVRAIPINKNKFATYADSRIKFENSLIGQSVVGFNTNMKKFMLGTIIKRVDYGHTYKIKWCDDNTDELEEGRIFGAFQQPVQHERDDFVLAMDDDQTIYKLAQVITHSSDHKTLTVHFIDSEDNEK